MSIKESSPATKRSAAVAPEVNLRVSIVYKHARKNPPVLKSKADRHEQISKIGVTVARQNGLMFSKKKFNKSACLVLISVIVFCFQCIIYSNRRRIRNVSSVSATSPINLPTTDESK